MFAAGYDIDPGAYEQLIHSSAAAGYLVAAPASPGMAPSQGPVTEAQLPNVPGDLSAVATRLVADGLADPGRLAAVGHSDGASAVGALTLTADHADARFRAFVVLAGDITTLPDSYGPRNAAPLLAATGDADEFGNAVLTPQLYGTAAAPKALVVAHGGSHLGSFLGDTPGHRDARGHRRLPRRVAAATGRGRRSPRSTDRPASRSPRRVCRADAGRSFDRVTEAQRASTLRAMSLPAPSPHTTSVITGASSGIGAEIARQLASRGRGVTLVARRELKLLELAEALQARYGTRAEVITADLTEPDARANIATELETRGLKVDVLVNNAGFTTWGPVHKGEPTATSA